MDIFYQTILSRNYSKTIWNLINSDIGEITKEGFELYDLCADSDCTTSIFDLEEDDILKLSDMYLKWIKNDKISITIHSFKAVGGAGHTEVRTDMLLYMPVLDWYNLFVNSYEIESISEVCTDQSMTNQLFTMDGDNLVFNNITYEDFPNEIWVIDHSENTI